MVNPYPLRRDQLAKFIPDNETILRFQKLFQIVGGEPGTGDMSALEAAVQELEFYTMTRSVD